MTHERTKELLNKMINQMMEDEGLNARAVIMNLLELGFTADELIELKFSADEVRDLANEFVINFRQEPFSAEELKALLGPHAKELIEQAVVKE